ncbi:double-headed protease inhibitor, submandibular gland-like [Melopsittacus undulatus]|uniref:double-headed protease inhibitor, submandibular gland-like n=1 Tax=Melopsittacus undulatus TaxID=13146 RepID=UPI00146F4335|nr:double-headed protease inhibitor, submandibular gland-like [Melopsittacus undulatus]
MKTTRSVALLGLALLSCLSDIVIARRLAFCDMYPFSGETEFNCPTTYEPICGTDGVTYPNECSLCREIFHNRAIGKRHDGRCHKFDCSGYLRPIRGRMNPCSMEYMPMCGTDGITYRNKCHFCNAVMSGLDLDLNNIGECSREDIDCGEQNGENLVCTSEYSPLCGSDGRTYGNRCHFCNAVSLNQGGLFLRHRGEC